MRAEPLPLQKNMAPFLGPHFKEAEWMDSEETKQGTVRKAGAAGE